MKGKSLLCMTAAGALAIAMISCGGGSNPAPETPAAGTPAAGGKAVDAATAGSVKGTIKLEGAAPKRKTINVAAGPSCAKQHTSPAMTEDVVTGDGGSLQNVVVYLKGYFSQYTFDMPKSPVTVDQKGCQYTPHVLAMMTGQP